ncbi:hypothetical protein [Mesorhizobium sp.]|uniref:hypothetical protein n=1 Tax=Mesorhizobium sp. TaxID=1871066 RepID=UPI000FE64DC7|nr:hypothetical protein [Mesorhizobium sp.]RWN11743.1 MAG: hypothetical protein EOR87_14580 [Mesorhizobium sp.]RWN19470.1 MAG: hypothetical protein EOR88_09985 [Mesorhizobium sp.]
MLCAFLTLSGCGTTKPSVIVETKVEKDRVPAALVAPIDAPWRKPGAPANARAGGAETVEDLFTRGDANETRLLVCTAQVNGVRAWDKP